MAGVPAALVSILAAAGGGSSGFGGGGGGGGGFSGGGGFVGGTGGGSGGALIFVLIAVVVVIVVLASAVSSRRYRRRREARVEQVRLAAAEAAEDDAWFAPDAVARDADALFCAVQQAWDARDRRALARMVFPDLMVEWDRRLDDFDAKGWHNRVQVLDGPRVEYVGLVNREDDDQDRVVVRLEARLRDVVELPGGQVMTHEGTDSETVDVCEYWTLARRGDRWVVASIEQRAEGDHQLSEEIVASPWSDTGQLRDAAIVEGAVADKALPGFSTADIADPDFAGDARGMALDLALADGRFAPDVLEVAVRRAVGAWVEAIDGADDALLAIADRGTVRELLHPGDPSETTRLVIRGGHVEQVRIEAVDARRQPARMTVAVRVRGRRYVEDRDTAEVVSGSPNRETTFEQRWTFALSGPDDSPWRLAGVARAGA